MLKLVGKGSTNGREAKKRYLLFDSGCSACTEIAEAVEKETEGWLTVRSLRDAEVQEMLSKARPDWQWEPTLLEVDGENALAFTGLSMRIRMFMGLGPRRAARAAGIAFSREPQGFDIELSPVASPNGSESYKIESVKYIDRRTALKTMGALGLSAALLPMLPQGVLAQSGASNDATRTANGHRINVRKMSKSQLERAIRRIGNDTAGKKLQQELKDQDFKADLRRTQGMTIASSRGNGWFVMMPYKGEERDEDALLFFSNVKGEIRTDFSIREGDEAEAYAVVRGEVEKVGEAELKRARNSQANDSRSAQDSCSACLTVAPYVIGAGCGAYGSLVTTVACSAATGFVGTLACAAIVGALYAVVCTGFTELTTDEICESVGYC